MSNLSHLTVSKERIDRFKNKIETEGREFCLSLFMRSEMFLLAAKYLYYTQPGWEIMSDVAYDIEEKGWCVMGQALGEIDDETSSPCVGFDETHRSAAAGIELAERLKRRPK